MRFTIEITKKSLLIICAVIIICSGFIVYAWNSNAPATMGHTWNEMNCDSNLCVKEGNIGIGTVNSPSADGLTLYNIGGISVHNPSPFIKLTNEIIIPPGGATPAPYTLNSMFLDVNSLDNGGFARMIFSNGISNFTIRESDVSQGYPLYFDFVNNRVGVYTLSNPQCKFDINGNICATNISVEEVRANNYYSGGAKGIDKDLDVYQPGFGCHLIIRDGLIVGTTENCL